MERIDPGKAAAVWQRVQSTAQPKQISRKLTALIQEELTEAALYQQLFRKTQNQPLLQQLARQSSAHAACLRGMYLLLTGEYPAPFTPQLGQGATEPVLRRCYGHTLSRVTQYEALSADLEYGMVFSRLTKQAQEQCHNLLILLGSFKR